jgi:hypothetical protein
VVSQRAGHIEKAARLILPLLFHLWGEPGHHTRFSAKHVITLYVISFTNVAQGP